MKKKILIYKNPITGKILQAEIISFNKYGIKIKSSEFITGLVLCKDVIEIKEN
jgi:DNA-directed RNA polymerase subunit E'/Rpb7